MIRNFLGLAPQLEKDGSYRPSKVALKLGVSKITDFENVNYSPYPGTDKKILAIFTETKNLTMKNDKVFSTGNHPVEALLPMLHLRNAGFDIEIYTPTGKPVAFEMWAYPVNDAFVNEIYEEFMPWFHAPRSLAQFTPSLRSECEDYKAVFVPGGHGAMIDLPKNEDVGKVLKWAHENNIYTISLCHGPGALLATKRENETFLYEGYNMAVFPDSVDNMTPLFGYLPGKMPDGLSAKLKILGVELVNTKMDKTVCLDRKLITGASPLASNELGKLAAETLLADLPIK